MDTLSFSLQNLSITESESYKRGCEFYRSGNFALALATFTQCIQQEPKNFPAYNAVGACLYSLGRPQEANQLWTDLAKLDPNMACVYNNQGLIVDDAGDVENAFKLYNRAITLNPDVANFYYNRGSCNRRLKRYKEAVEDYTKAIEINVKVMNLKDEADFYYNRAVAYILLGNYKEAILDLRQSARFNPSLEVDIQVQLALAHLGNHDISESMEACVKATELDKDYPITYFARGKVNMQKRKYHYAIENFERFLSYKVKDSDLEDQVGELLRQCRAVPVPKRDPLKGERGRGGASRVNRGRGGSPNHSENSLKKNNRRR